MSVAEDSDHDVRHARTFLHDVVENVIGQPVAAVAIKIVAAMSGTRDDYGSNFRTVVFLTLLVLLVLLALLALLALFVFGWMSLHHNGLLRTTVMVTSTWSGIGGKGHHESQQQAHRADVANCKLQE